MKMEINWFADYLKKQLPGIVEGTPLASDGPAVLLAISERNGGCIIGKSTRINDSLRQQHAIAAAEEGLQAWFAQQVTQFCPKPSAEFPQPMTVAAAPQTGSTLDLHRLVPKVSLNGANYAELEALPGIGPSTAKAIVSHRERLGPFQAVEDVRKVHGISAAAFAKFVGQVTVEPVSSSLENPKFTRFRTERSLASFAAWSQQAGDAPVADQVLTELRRAQAWVGTSPFPPMRHRRAIAVDDATRLYDRIARASQVEEKAITDVTLGALVFDTAYLSFVTNLIEQAQKSIRLLMFFVRYEDEESYPVYGLIQALIGARKRGLDIKVLLDKDRETDIYKSRIINKEAFSILSAADISVRFDSPEQLTHTKMITVDGRHTVVGSHNWTAGSMYAYDDTSIYLESAELSAYYENDFQSRFDTGLPE